MILKRKSSVFDWSEHNADIQRFLIFIYQLSHELIIFLTALVLVTVGLPSFSQNFALAQSEEGEDPFEALAEAIPGVPGEDYPVFAL